MNSQEWSEEYLEKYIAIVEDEIAAVSSSGQGYKAALKEERDIIRKFVGG